MSTYQEFMDEKLKIDAFINDGYTIHLIKGTLEGDIVEFTKTDDIADKQSILLKDANSRKYVTTILIKKQLQKN
ncbi:MULTISPECIES: hypothetical protein [Oceanobacillus]|uniref:DUF2187 domain-containing protein n=1 Tax=Oceanobacillus kimchii TaxID=746691 RepID=A0ABQ5TMY8_9BACI|nr:MULTISPECIES: hypothetical protein [Oceanobacillus]MBT2600411.1 hypothetical protein [Oceanobacillus sp. ISL-74]MBT2650569.1 hypothetical protein [Oceanobacillus sp. ISL-73]MCT1578310.1 hypothetical protein [Oceanobacillus kimchii]MCT2134488.1 hypothetical protein [Oceanobacillus kimchii]OEH54888.1 hypothetical protein AQ616_07520 [Oceanobacillus sp. E9]